MTCTRSCLTVASASDKRSAQARRKAELICPRCTLASPPTGEWIWVEREDGTELRCPNCYKLLTVRYQFDESDIAPQPKQQSD